jgi:hypothetical protein
MASSLNGTGVTFSDSTSQSTARTASNTVTSINGQVGAVTTTDFTSIGAHIIGRPTNYNTQYVVNDTVAGSSLNAGHSTSLVTSGNTWGSSWLGGTFTPTNLGTGTWRCLGPTVTQANYSTVTLWVRIS